MAFKLLLRVGPHPSPRAHDCSRVTARQRLHHPARRASSLHNPDANPGPTMSDNIMPTSKGRTAAAPVHDPMSSDSSRDDSSASSTESDSDLSESDLSAEDVQPEKAGQGAGPFRALSKLQGLRSLSFGDLCEEFDEWLGAKRVHEKMNPGAPQAQHCAS